jgi:hypothetical protein
MKWKISCRRQSVKSAWMEEDKTWNTNAQTKSKTCQSLEIIVVEAGQPPWRL